jgi:hypothetical protein
VIDRDQYLERFKSMPNQDDLTRVNCAEAGTFGHGFCGLCAQHDLPRFFCGCIASGQSLTGGTP